MLCSFVGIRSYSYFDGGVGGDDDDDGDADHDGDDVEYDCDDDAPTSLIF